MKRKRVESADSKIEAIAKMCTQGVPFTKVEFNFIVAIMKHYPENKASVLRDLVSKEMRWETKDYSYFSKIHNNLKNRYLTLDGQTDSVLKGGTTLNEGRGLVLLHPKLEVLLQKIDLLKELKLEVTYEWKE